SAAEVAAKAVGQARACGYKPVLAEALSLQGTALRNLNPAQAEEALSAAFSTAFATRFDRIATEVAISLAYVYAVTTRYDQSAVWERHAQAGLERINGNEELEAYLWFVRSIRSYGVGKFDDELAAAARAARLSE